MLLVGITHVKLKESGEDRVLLSALARRTNTQGFDVLKCWVDPREFSRSGLALGDQFRQFKDGGLLVLESIPFDMKVFENVF